LEVRFEVHTQNLKCPDASKNQYKTAAVQRWRLVLTCVLRFTLRTSNAQMHTKTNRK
jgi:hypothetical protein